MLKQFHIGKSQRNITMSSLSSQKVLLQINDIGDEIGHLIKKRKTLHGKYLVLKECNEKKEDDVLFYEILSEDDESIKNINI